ncbi:hypothetical protein JI435_407270, partial [Parastagonospora nodorum SN15]
ELFSLCHSPIRQPHTHSTRIDLRSCGFLTCEPYRSALLPVPYPFFLHDKPRRCRV